MVTPGSGRVVVMFAAVLANRRRGNEVFLSSGRPFLIFRPVPVDPVDQRR
jgi:hypothetical protein